MCLYQGGTMQKKIIIQEIISISKELEEILLMSESAVEFRENLKVITDSYFSKNPIASQYYSERETGYEIFSQLQWQDYAAIRIADMLDYEGDTFIDPNLHNKEIINRPFTLLWNAVQDNPREIAKDLLVDLLMLFKQFYGKLETPKVTEAKVKEWMKNHKSGLDKDIQKIREKNKERIIKIIRKIIIDNNYEKGSFQLNKESSEKEQLQQIKEWWNTSSFHLTFAVRDSELLNEMLDYSLDKETLNTMEDAENHGVPIFVNPYYLSLLNIEDNEGKVASDLAIRMYIFYSRSLIEEFGQITAWEKEDIVKPGEPNAAGWLLPSHNIHRRYPEVAIFIPDTIGRACGGLCSSCQRMYGFQSGDFNFELERLAPKESWPEKMKRLLAYYREDSQLRDILITGGDALMSSDKSLKNILDAVYDMAKNKIEDNKKRDKKFAEIRRIRLGTRLPVYLPQRITDNLVKILKDFRDKAKELGITQFVIQTHFESAMEVTPEVKAGIKKLLNSGWYITNQQVFTMGAALRGHTAKLRKVLNDIGVFTYYTFSVKGFRENRNNFATNARAVQEQLEEKHLGKIPSESWEDVIHLTKNPSKMIENIENLRNKLNIPFLSTDRNVINLPGIGKSQTFRTIGLTDDGRRILLFDHDHNRNHSPIINDMGKVVIIESKTVEQFLREIEQYGDDPKEYQSIYGYSISETEPLMPVFKYPQYDYPLTNKVTNFKM